MSSAGIGTPPPFSAMAPEIKVDPLLHDTSADVPPVRSLGSTVKARDIFNIAGDGLIERKKKDRMFRALFCAPLPTAHNLAAVILTRLHDISILLTRWGKSVEMGSPGDA
jgi:hypothetical protein